VELLAVAANRGVLEERFRATRILGRLANTDTEAAASAQEALRRLVTEGDESVRKQARDELAPWLRLEEMQKLAIAFPLFDLADPKQPSRLVAAKEPLLRFQDQERTHYDGTLWAFGAPGRPSAFLCVYSRIDRDSGGTAWASDVVSISRQPLHAESVDGVDGQNWTPKASSTSPKPIPDAETVDADKDARVAQAIKLSARFAAREAWPPTAPPRELTLTTKPLLRYSDQEVADGMVFAFMHETNPEIVLLLESRPKGDKLIWHYQLARQAAAALWVDLDGREVWADPTPQDYQSGGDMSYWNFRRRATP